ncbi:ABC transporter substrate-binding protein [Aeromicrobium sp. Leaf245]|uniref:taurine ABC transporter substrate-binding protein n=1 Tax=Aeromicrobium sp. Leaf245 TaxID=1736306 RepID=UPI0006FEE10A|nr:ABC transporter substrate-binding protein [Aeromicrobium sp. Leaf245]KQO36354.1 glycine/betaine ABC transporter substrate-binding protein [Aeromicrobium sp. Leaf245]
MKTPLLSRTPVAAALAAVVATLGLTACGVGGETTQASADACPFEADESVDTTVRIGYQKIPNGDVVVKDQRILENCLPNATIEWSNFASGGDVVQAFGGGSLDIGLAGSSPSTKALSAPLDLPVSVIWVHDVIGSAESLAVRGGEATDIAGLKGKTIATPFGSTAHFSLLQAIADAGEDASDYKLVNSEPEQIAPTWSRGDIDAAWIWDPTLSELKKDGGKVILTSEDTAKAGKPTFDLAIADDSFIEDNPEVLAVWAKAQDYAVKQIKSDPEKAAESVAVEVGVTAAEAQKQFEGFVFLDASQQVGADYLGGKLGQDLFTTAEFLLTQDGIAEVAPESDYADGVDPGPAEAAAGE